jgi:heterodisulfide reductase subunit C2
MRHPEVSSDNHVDSGFGKQVAKESGVNISRCYQCLTCTLSCPLAFSMDYLPHQIVRMVQLDEKEKVLRSATIWACASCETCGSRCPNEINVPVVIDTLRHIAIRENVKPKKSVVPIFHKIFLSSVRRFGKSYELGMLLELKLRTMDIFSDLFLGMKMLLKGKLTFLPAKIQRLHEVDYLFNESKGS